MRTLTYFVATTIDGFCCGPDGSFDFFPFEPDTQELVSNRFPETLPAAVRAMLGIDDAENQQYDAILQGKGSYQIALDEGVTSPYPHAKQYVFSTSLAADLDPAVTVVGTDPCDYVRGLKQEPGLGLCLLGGPGIAGVLLPEIDELMIKRYPIIAGHGKPLFATGFDPQGFTRAWSHSFDSGADYTLFRRVGQG
ncbi:dihydrofolate reductase family protein [Microlunatus speluncae]|uniref:dihydrofolate reductase family protein n=1 Tax=Microlunatus speluncae TaxID=2594267 RepID=UPI001266687D|nr:dihydrofolate reductase [Microlunatus speluncae]